MTQLSLGKTIALITLHDLANLPHLMISIKLVDGRQKNKTLLTSQSPGETTLELLRICQYQYWMAEE
jgi:hypothetical protein